MDRETIINEFKVFLNDFLKTRNLDLVDLIYRYESRDLFLRILVDKPDGGINLGECAVLNRELSDILDEKNILQDRFILEVSSPGLDRPLKTENNFLRCLNKNAKFFLSDKISGKLEWDGVIKRVSDGKVYIQTAAGSLEIPLGKINKAKLII